MAEHAEPFHIQPARKLAGRISGVHLLQLADYKLRVAGPHGQEPIDQAVGLIGWQILGIVSRRSGDCAFVRKHDNAGSVGASKPTTMYP
jgi:hypothetical protein